MADDNFIKILGAGVENIISTNSVPSRVAKIDIAPTIASCICNGR